MVFINIGIVYSLIPKSIQCYSLNHLLTVNNKEKSEFAVIALSWVWLCIWLIPIFVQNEHCLKLNSKNYHMMIMIQHLFIKKLNYIMIQLSGFQSNIVLYPVVLLHLLIMFFFSFSFIFLISMFFANVNPYNVLPLQILAIFS